MADICRLSPVVFKRNGIKIEEVDSKLFQDIKDAVKDDDTAWKMWAYTKTTDFKNKYKSKVHYDELGEVTFPSLIKALGLEDEYNESKDKEAVAKEYGFNNVHFDNAQTAVNKINAFNAQEKKFVAILQKDDEGYKVNILPRIGNNIQNAKEQSYRYALTGEILQLLNSMGFGVEFISDPKFDGLFNPENTTLVDGLLNIISIANGERGENALPEEFSHLIIEGLINHPLVQRLFSTLDDNRINDILGETYDEYYQKYGGDGIKLKKEAAGKLLAQYITKKGTIAAETIRPHISLLSRIWNWAKSLFARITNRQIDNARTRAEDAVAGIYNLVSSGEVVSLIDKVKVTEGQNLYFLKNVGNSAEEVAVEAERIVAKMLQVLHRNNADQKQIKNTRETLSKLQNFNSGDIKVFESIFTFLGDTRRQIAIVKADAAKMKRLEEKGNLKTIQVINNAAKVARRVDDLVLGYQGIIDTITSFGSLSEEELKEVLSSASIGKESLDKLAEMAGELRKELGNLTEWRHNTSRNILYWSCRTVYKEDVARGIGSKRDEIMSLTEILKHADRDINYIDRWFSAMSDADDAYLTMFDGIVKNQQYERDMEMMYLRAKIAALDEKLRKAGFTSDFMFERDENGVPTGKIISIYDWKAYREAYKKQAETLSALQKKNGLSEAEYKKQMKSWVERSENGFDRRIRVYIDPNAQALYEKTKSISAVEEQYPTALYEMVPNPAVYGNKKNTLDNLAPAQREYYDAMMEIKREMMTKIPRRGQRMYNAIYISKDFIEGIINNSTGNPLKATKDYYMRRFVRRPDDIGFGTGEDFPQMIREILTDQKDSKAAADEIISKLSDTIDDDILISIKPKRLEKIIEKYDRRLNSKEISSKEALDSKVRDIIEAIASENFYIVETDFADHTIQKLPIYYSRPLRDMRMLSTDFSGSMVAYSAMAINYEKMNEVVDILEVGRTYAFERGLRETEGNKPIMSKFKALDKLYKSYVEIAGSGTNIAGRINDYMDSVVYEERKNNEGTVQALGVNIDVAKTLDAVKDYTGLVGLGFNIFSTISNVTVGKLQQWIEAIGGEYFTLKDYAKACAQYAELMPGCLAEMASPVKKNKLSLLIQMFDPMGDYYESLRDSNYNKNVVSRIFGNGVLAYIGMNAGEHLLHCQTMLAILNNTKLIDLSSGDKKAKISLFDALEVVEENGITRLKLKEGLAYERELIDKKDNVKHNKNYGKPLRDKDGKIVTELVPIEDSSEEKTIRDALHGRYSEDETVENPKRKALQNYLRYIMKKKRIVRKVNDTLNGAFSANDKGAIHKKAVGRLVMQFRQWMPAHYNRRFARAHYDNDLEQWKEGYYVTVAKTLNQMRKELRKSGFKVLTLYKNLSEHERANLRRANAEIGEFLILMTLIRVCGRVKDRDRSWMEKMGLYQLRRAFLEVGASMPLNGGFFNNIITILQSPAASIDTFEKFSRVLKFWNLLDEIETGRYQGWTEWHRDLFEAIPAAPQMYKAWYFDDSMFSVLENDD